MALAKPSKAKIKADIIKKYGSEIKPKDLKILTETLYLRKVAKRFNAFPFKMN